MSICLLSLAVLAAGALAAAPPASATHVGGREHPPQAGRQPSLQQPAITQPGTMSTLEQQRRAQELQPPRRDLDPPDIGDVFGTRTAALVIGAVWLWLALRRERRKRTSPT